MYAWERLYCIYTVGRIVSMGETRLYNIPEVGMYPWEILDCIYTLGRNVSIGETRLYIP
jgi:hypothetical protein